MPFVFRSFSEALLSILLTCDFRVGNGADNRPDFDLVSAQRGSWVIEPSAGMLERLRGDYAKTIPMILGAAPTFEEIMSSMKKLNDSVNKG